MEIALFVLTWAWMAWVSVVLYGCASRMHQVLELLKRLNLMPPPAA
ncbi:hypothetical protein P7B02_18810 [Caulobacter segnis]|nr:hypothetical protein [Caulobacter segnis]MDG2523585.1 hypothetical protein [Caulobacter segnis]